MFSHAADQASDGDHVSLRRLLCATAALPAASLALMLAFTPEVGAAAEVYTIAPGSHLDFTYLGGSQAVTGEFTLNTANTAVASVDLVLTGNYPEAGTYDKLISSGTNGFIAGTASAPSSFQSGAGTYLGITGFTPSFGASTVTAADGRFYSFTAGGGINFSLPGIGSVDAALPEPSSIAILGAALGFLGVRKKASWLRRHFCRGRAKAAEGPNRSWRDHHAFGHTIA
jgi:hypothetical protein